MDTRFSAFLGKTSTFCLYLVILLTPLFFLPFSLDVLELNKYFLFYFLILISLISFLGRAVVRKVLEFRRTPLDIPVLAVWGTFLLASLLSKERYLSFFGDFGFMGLSFIGFSMMVIFYFLVTQNIIKINQVVATLYAFLASAGLSGLYFILKSFGLVKLLQLWNVTNNSNTLFGIYLVIALLLALGMLTVKKEKLWRDILTFVGLVLSLMALVLIGFKLVWVILAAGLFLMLIFFLTYVDQVNTVWTSFGFAVLLGSLLFIFLGTPQLLTVRLPVEVSLGAKASWEIGFKTLTSSAKPFIFGSGPATFVYDYSQYRPEAFNNNFAWNVRFRQPYSSAFNWMAEVGVLGAVAMLAVVLMVLGLIISTLFKNIVELRRRKRAAIDVATDFAKLKDSPFIFWSIVTVWLTLLISFFFVNFGLVQWFLFWFFMSLMITASAHMNKKEVEVMSVSLKASPQYALITSFGLIFTFTIIVVLGVYLGRFFAAEVVYARALQQPLDQRLITLQQAVTLNGSRVEFYLALADSYLNKASEINQKGGDMNQITQAVAAAVNSAKAATGVSPNNVATWEYLSTMYANARAVAPEANSWVMSSLERAITLESTNPVFYVGLGNAKLLEKRYTEAKHDFEKAIKLKPDLVIAYVRLALLSESQNNVNDAISALERGLNYGRQDAGYIFQLGRYYFNRNQKDDYGLAELAFRRAIALNPNYSDALFSLAYLYEKTNHKSEALQLYKRVLELNPDNKDLKAKISSLSSSPAPEEPKQ